MRPFLIIILLCFLNVTAHAEEAITIEQFTLDNGMEVAVVPNTKMPVVSHMVWYKTGAINEQPGKSGLAHFLEHLMFKATDTLKSGEFSAKVARLGGNDNAFTSYDYTAYYQNVAREKLPEVMQMEASRMRGLQWDEDEVAKERDVIIQERRMRIDNDPQALLREQMSAALYLNHPYGRPLIGWLQEMQGLTMEDAKDWYDSYYAPNNAILVVTGDITAEELRPLAERYYGQIEPRTIPRALIPEEPAHNAAVQVVLQDPRVEEREWSRYYLAPSQTNSRDGQAYALLVLSRLLGEGRTSLLYKKLVMEQKIAASAGSFYDDLQKGPSIFGLYAVPASPQVQLKAIEEAITPIVKELQEKGPTKADLARVKEAMVAEAIYAREDLKTLGYIVGQTLVTGLPVEYVTGWEDNIKAVTASEVKEAARAVLKDNTAVTGQLLPEKKKEEVNP